MPVVGDDVVPSHLEIRKRERHHEAFGNTFLRLGEVADVVLPDDKRSLSKKFIEYSVYTQHRANGTAVTKMYDHCVLVNMMAGLADESTFTLRADSEANRKKGLGKGSKVLLLCINGETNNAVILGGVRDSSSTYDKDNASKGHHYHWVFNGASIDVDDDGELTLKFSGKTKIDGTKDDSVSDDNAGSFIQFDKDGHIVQKPKQGVLTGSASDHTLLGESFRNAQKQMDTKLQSQLSTLQGLLTTAATALNTAGTSMSVPIAGAVAAAPQILAAGAALTAAAQIVNQMGQAFQAFEQAASQKNSFLSQKNKSD